jgi:hypothetical protein
VRVPVAGKGGRRRTRVLARIPLAVPAGPGARTVRVAIPRAARRTLRRATGASVVVALGPKGGRRTTTTLKIRR